MDQGIDPAEATTQQWMDAIDKVKGAVESGQIRSFTGNDYIQNLAKGSVVAAIDRSSYSGSAGFVDSLKKVAFPGIALSLVP